MLPLLKMAKRLKAYQKHHFALILLDIDMPFMDGKEVFKGVRAYEKDKGLNPSTIVAITASSDEENRQNLLQLGFDNFIAKPIHFETFKELIETYL